MPEPTQTPTAGLTRPVPAPMDKAPSSWATTSTLRRRETTSLLSGPMPAISSPPTSPGDLRIYLGSHNSHLTRPRDPSRGLALAVQHRKRDRRDDHLAGASVPQGMGALYSGRPGRHHVVHQQDS